jgi:hypothetical protein
VAGPRKPLSAESNCRIPKRPKRQNENCCILKASLDPKGCFYALRHAYISESIEKNVPPTIIAENCGTSVRMIEQTYAKVLFEKKRKFVEQGAPKLRFKGS